MTCVIVMEIGAGIGGNRFCFLFFTAAILSSTFVQFISRVTSAWVNDTLISHECE